jgi:hypothetical protein
MSPLRKIVHLPAFILLTCLFLLSCESNTPLEQDPEPEPVITEKALSFFPLSPDFVAEYEYASRTEPGSRRHSPLGKWAALLRLEVVDNWSEGLTAGYKLRKTLLHPVEGYEGTLKEMAAEDIDHSQTIVEEFDLLYQDSTLWYVDDAPSFEKLTEGTLTVFFEDPADGQGQLNLRMYSYQDIFSLDLQQMHLFSQLHNQEDESGNVLHRWSFDFLTTLVNYGHVFAIADKGITFIRTTEHEGQTSYSWTHERTIELIQRN